MAAARRARARSVAGAISIALAAFAAAQSEPIAITNVRLENGDGTVVERTTIVMQDGKFVSVGERVNIPQNAKRVDGTGMVAYPGFIDAFSRRMLALPEIDELPEAPDARENAPATFWRENRKGITAHWNAAEIFDAESLDKRVWRQGITTINAASGRGIFGGASSLINLTPNEDRRVVDSVTGQTIGFAPSQGRGYPGSIMGRIAQIRQMLMDAQFEAKNPSGDEADKDVKAVASLYTDGTKALFIADSEREIHRALELAEMYDFKMIIAGAKGAWRHEDRLKRMNVDVILDVDAGERPAGNPFGREIPDEVRQDNIREWENEAIYAVQFQKTGQRFAFSGDRTSGEFLAKIRQHIGFGLPRAAALRAMTVDAAAILGADRQIGSVKQGYIANLVLMSGDFANSESTVKHLFVAGEEMDLTEEQR